MAAALPPPTPPAIVVQAPECLYLSQRDANLALARLQRALPSTAFESASPSEICGMVRVKLANGTSAYTDVTGRYLLLAFALDTHRGSPADNSETLEQAIDSRSEYPGQAIPGVLPPPIEGPLISLPPQISLPR